MRGHGHLLLQQEVFFKQLGIAQLQGLELLAQCPLAQERVLQLGLHRSQWVIVLPQPGLGLRRRHRPGWRILNPAQFLRGAIDLFAGAGQFMHQHARKGEPLLAGDHGPGPRLGQLHAELGVALAHDSDLAEARGQQLIHEFFFRKQPHFQGRAGAAVEGQIGEGLDHAVGPAIDQDELLFQLDDAVGVEVGEMFPGLVFEAGVGDGEDQEPVRLQQPRGVFESASDRRLDMLENFSGNDEIVLSGVLGAGVGDVKLRLLVIV